MTLNYTLGERDDWTAHISVMEHSLHCVGGCVCMAVHAYIGEYIIITLQNVFYHRLCSSLSEGSLFYRFVALKWPFSNLTSNAATINVVL